MSGKMANGGIVNSDSAGKMIVGDRVSGDSFGWYREEMLAKLSQSLGIPYSQAGHPFITSIVQRLRAFGAGSSWPALALDAANMIEHLLGEVRGLHKERDCAFVTDEFKDLAERLELPSFIDALHGSNNPFMKRAADEIELGSDLIRENIAGRMKSAEENVALRGRIRELEADNKALAHQIENLGELLNGRIRHNVALGAEVAALQDRIARLHKGEAQAKEPAVDLAKLPGWN